MFLEKGVKGLTAGGHFSEIFLSKENVSASLMGVKFSTQILMYKMLTLVYFPPSTTRGYRTKIRGLCLLTYSIETLVLYLMSNITLVSQKGVKGQTAGDHITEILLSYKTNLGISILILGM